MSLSFALYGDKRKKGIGGPVKIEDSTIAKFHSRITRKQMTDVQLAANNLDKELKSYQEISDGKRSFWKDEMSGMEQVRYMNMKVLAAVLVYLSSVNDDVTPENFNDANLKPYLNKLIPATLLSKSDDEIGIIIRFKENMLRYIRVVINYRSEFRQKIEEVRVAPIIEE